MSTHSTTTRRPTVAVNDVVSIVKPRGPHEIADAVVLAIQDHPLPLEGGGLLPSKLYGLQWPDGGTTWHRRHEFEPLPDTSGGLG